MVRIAGALVFMLLVKQAVSGEFHVFTDVSGRAIEARLIGYDPQTHIVKLERPNGESGKIPLQQLCKADHKRIRQWQTGQAFLDEKQLAISIRKNESNWEKQANQNELKKKSTTYDITFANHTKDDFVEVFTEYCVYRDRKDYIDVKNYEMEMGILKSGDTYQTQSPSTHLSYMRSSSGYRSEICGARFRFTMVMDDGSEIVREMCMPDKLLLEKYPWRISDREREIIKTNAPKPESYPEIELTDDKVREIANAYIKAFKNDDFESWEKLMFPMHPGHPRLNNNYFQKSRNKMKGMKVDGVNELNVRLIVRNELGAGNEQWMRITPSGHIKYTPHVFEHPVVRGLKYLPQMLSENPSLREQGAEVLETAGIPLFDYSVNGTSPRVRKDSVVQILDWIKDNGKKHDATKPEVHILFDELEKAYNTAYFRIHKVYAPKGSIQ